MRVLVWRGGWRAEQWPDGWRLHYLGGLVLSRASLDEVVTRLLREGVDPEADLLDG